MKKLYIIGLALLMAAFAKADINQSSIQFGEEFVAEIIHLAFDKNSIFNQDHFAGGTVRISENEITVSLAQKATHCPPNAYCSAMVPKMKTFQAKLIEETSSCGSKFYRALADKMPIDGNRIEIIVSDHRTRLCKDLKRFKTEINISDKYYDRVNGKAVEFHHYFGAKKLQLLK